MSISEESAAFTFGVKRHVSKQILRGQAFWTLWNENNYIKIKHKWAFDICGTSTFDKESKTIEIITYVFRITVKK
jgi:hypothetical protein